MKLQLAVLLSLSIGGTAFAQSTQGFANYLKTSTTKGYLTEKCDLRKTYTPQEKKLRRNKLATGTGDKTKAFYAKQVAENLLRDGYNYALIAPLKTSGGQERIEGVSYGWGRAEKKTFAGKSFTNYIVTCTAIDDVAASDIMWGDELEPSLRRDGLKYNIQGRAFVDIRQFISALNLDVDAGPRRAKIHESHFQRAGDRERLTKQIDVRNAASQCRTGLAPVSLDDYTPNESSRDPAGEKACLEGLRSQAVSVGWDNFPLFRDEAKSANSTRGYSINRPAATSINQSTTGQKQADPTKWGSKWTIYNTDFANFDGVFLGASKPGETAYSYVVASNTMSDLDLLDYAVFMSAKQALPSGISGIAVKDETEASRGQFEANQKRIFETRQRRSKISARPKPGSVDQIDINRLERRIAKLDADIAKTVLPANDADDIMEELAINMQAFPNADIDVEAIKKQIMQTRAATSTAQSIALKKRRAEKQKELDVMRQTIATQNLNAAPSQSESLSGDFSNMRPSLEIPADNDDRSWSKGKYYAFETYKNVLIFHAEKISRCPADRIVCTDKIQAYNALGPRLRYNDFTHLSEPIKYKAYVQSR